jgi:hypothetical protein
VVVVASNCDGLIAVILRFFFVCIHIFSDIVSVGCICVYSKGVTREEKPYRRVCLQAMNRGCIGLTKPNPPIQWLSLLVSPKAPYQLECHLHASLQKKKRTCILC